MLARGFFQAVTGLALLAAGAVMPAGAAALSPNLDGILADAADTDAVGTVIITFEGQGGLSDEDLSVLRAAGIDGGYTLNTLGMVAAPATAGQVRDLASHPAVRSIWSNDRLEYYLHQATVMAGVDRMQVDMPLTIANGGLPVSGRGNFSVVVNDSGIDGTRADLSFPDHVVENVQVLTDTETASGFTPLLTAEGVPNTDSHVGHGTHVAGIVGGTGGRSGGLYTGVAPGARIIGTGSGAGLFILAGLGGFEWALSNQFLHNIRVITNSWGSVGRFDPDNPLNVATKRAADRNIVVIFSAGNSGPGLDTHNQYSQAPWVISVAAGTKEGTLVDFSSRGTPDYERLNDDDPSNDFDAPTITAPGTGRAFDANAGRFTSDIVSVRATSNVVSTGLDADTEIPPAYLPYYTQISGTSMAAPFVAGVVALMLDADPTLSDEAVRAILEETATPMPGYEEFEVGAGYINARAAVDAVFNRGKPYGAAANPDFELGIAVSQAEANETFTIDYEPAEPGPDSPNTYRFQVAPGLDLMHARIDFGNNIATDESGNVMGIQLYAPDGTTYSSGLTLPALDLPQAELRVRDPVPGEWIAEVRGLRGVNVADMSVTQPIGLAVPEQVDGTIKRFDIASDPVPDIEGHAAEAVIRNQLAARRMDVLADGLFHPDDTVSREDFTRTLALNVPMRQFLAGTPRFADVGPDLRVFAESATAAGSSLRGYDFEADGMVSAGDGFDPAAAADRLDAAVAFVRALGRDARARDLAGTTVTVDGTPLVDNDEIPSRLRGYVQLSLDAGVQEAFPAEVREVSPGQFEAVPGPRFEPATVLTRAGLAATLNRFAPVFDAGP